MTATKCTNMLEQEHQTIHKAVGAMSVVADHLDAGLPCREYGRVVASNSTVFC